MGLNTIGTHCMKFICVGSGSSGNCYYLESKGTAILIDLGLGIRIFKKYLRDYGLTIPRIAAILVTHDHTDHVKSVGPFAREFGIPVYASPRTHEGVERNRYMTKKVPAELKRTTTVHEPFEIGNFRITPFPVPHDAFDNNGYFVELLTPEERDDVFAPDPEDPQPTFCLITDAGTPTPDMQRFVEQARHLVIEANYDEQMLQNGPYPAFLQRRIAGERGHMDNRDTAASLRQWLTPATRNIWLCHLSEENNHPDIARKTVQNAIDELDFAANVQLHVLPRRQATGIIHLN